MNSKYVPNDTQMSNMFGGFVPAIPKPYYLGKGLFGKQTVRCACGRVIKGENRYSEHFAFAHILGMERDNA